MAKNGSRKALLDVMTSRNVRRKRRQRIRGAALAICVLLCAGILLGGINLRMTTSELSRILSQEEAAQLEGVDCILVLGAKVQSNGEPSHMLEDRLRRGVFLYEAGAAPVIVMSGDHGQQEYDEVKSMKRYAVEQGVPSEDVFMDHAGFSTYESMYRLRDIFMAKKIIIVTQRYHMFRALYTARQLGLEAYGVTCDYRAYGTETYNNVREFFARIKAWFQCAVKPKPIYLGDPIPLNSSGDITNDEEDVFTPPTTQPPETTTAQPPVTEPPTTLPPATRAPTTQAPRTKPPTTQPPETELPETEAPETTRRGLWPF